MTRYRTSRYHSTPYSAHYNPNAGMARNHRPLPAIDGTANLQAFGKAHPTILAWMNANAATFEFAASLRAAVSRYGQLTERQLAAAQKCVDSSAQRQAQRAERAAQFQGTAFPRIVAAFTTAEGSGLRRPKLRCVAGDVEVTISKAGANSANPGFLYVKAGETYAGKISPAGQFMPGRDCPASMVETLQTIDANPMEAARNYARFTADRDGTVGNCCCCGALLTNPESVRLGIGPICGGRWGWL